MKIETIIKNGIFKPKPILILMTSQDLELSPPALRLRVGGFQIETKMRTQKSTRQAGSVYN